MYARVPCPVPAGIFFLLREDVDRCFIRPVRHHPPVHYSTCVRQSTTSYSIAPRVTGSLTEKHKSPDCYQSASILRNLVVCILPYSLFITILCKCKESRIMSFKPLIYNIILCFMYYYYTMRIHFRYFSSEETDVI